MKTSQILASALLLCPVASLKAKETPKKPNILCIVCEDISPMLGCYGDKAARTPNLDRLATEGVRYTRMFTSVGVCAPSRASLISGLYPVATGSNYMRNTGGFLPTGIEPYEVVLPEGATCFTEYLRANGYYCTNNEKTDYQFSPPLTAWDECSRSAHWKNRPTGQPFFAVFNIVTTHESKVWENGKLPLAIDPKTIRIPPYFPDDSVVRHDMAVVYSNIYKMDMQVQAYIDELKQANELENTIIIWYSDNGGPLPRQKREVLESGMLVPFMIRYPDGYKKAQIDSSLHTFVDIPATILSLAGIKPPAYMHGQAFAGKYESKNQRQYVYGARDRMDAEIDKQGAVRDKRFRYVRNYMPQIPSYMNVEYRLQMPMMMRMLELKDEGQLNDVQMQWFTAPRQAEEFYDVNNDPHEIQNLIHDPLFAEDVTRLRKEYDKWINKYAPFWEKRTEQEQRNLFMPNNKRYEQQKPVFRQSPKGVVISSADTTASFAYQINGKGLNTKHWFLYSGPVKVNKGDTITAVSVRAGCKNSPLSVLIIK